MKKKILLLSTCVALIAATQTEAKDISITITKKYLNLPVSHQVSRSDMTFEIDGKRERTFSIRLASGLADYWVFCDVSAFKDKELKISYGGDSEGLRNIYQADEIAGHENLYKEANRPQFHFTPRRGWHNDPNGLIYYEGEYHLFFQYNPYERDWGNMHWGHAVSKDLIHWEELPVALYPDEHGTMFSGSAVMDYGNTAGFNKGKTPAMIAIYTADGPKQVQCIAYSLDKGRTWTKYEGNPVIDSKAKWNSNDTRDPKVFRYEPNNEWVLVLNERDGHSIYTSSNLKEWNYESHTTGFWECPELFELPVDGDKDNKKWVMYGASGTYMTGSFDGKKFTPESGKYYYTTGALYAAQTYTNLPDTDGRRIQIGWGRITHPDMPFKSLMLLPTELTLRTTKDGVRLFSYPVKEVEQLQTAVFQKDIIQVKEANALLHPYSNTDCLRVQFTLKLSHATDAGFNLYGQQLLRYDMNFNTVNGVFYSPDDMTSMEISADVIIDKTSVEVFIDNGAYSYSMERKADGNNREGFHFWGNNIEIKDLKVYDLKSIWK
ncbi:MAG: glycoside hydrolase family 32 protein [Tannerella sp.]|jgi:fructan beta-fructosidase|nr:glycoside hydrolase family 32 protein [Tannerella sp.]